MNECARIADQLDRSYRGPAWHGPSLRENLERVTAATAAAHPVAGTHSIWEIVLHVAIWEAEVARVLDGKEYVTLQGEDEWPLVNETDEAAWKAAIGELERAHSTLREAVGRFPDERLYEKVSQREFSFYGLLHGILQHNSYHAGQIGLLRKAAQ